MHRVLLLGCFLSALSFAEYGYEPLPEGDPIVDSYVTTMHAIGTDSSLFSFYDELLRDHLHNEYGMDHPDMSQFYPAPAEIQTDPGDLSGLNDPPPPVASSGGGGGSDFTFSLFLFQSLGF